MKRLLAIFLIISSSTLLMVSSCKKNDTLIKTNGGTPGTLTASTTSPVLDKAKINDTTYVISFSFSPPAYNYNAVVTNTLQIDSAGDNWVHPVSVTMGLHVYQQGYSTLNFNNLLLRIVPAGVTSKVNVRIQHSLSSTVATYSNVSTLTVTPFNLTTWIYVPGDYEGWANDANKANAPHEDSLISKTGNGIYTGIIDFRGYAGSTGTLQFKLVPVKGDWTHSYGTFDQGKNTTIVLDGKNDANLWVPTAAPYLLTVNLNNNTISAVAVDYYSLIGNDFAGQNWDTDNWMKYVNDGSNNWVATLPMIAPSGGGFKVRQDGQWSNSWGFLHTPDGLNLTDATGSTGASNMSIPSDGTYTITFNMAPSAYGAAPVTLAPYTITKQ